MRNNIKNKIMSIVIITLINTMIFPINIFAQDMFWTSKVEECEDSLECSLTLSENIIKSANKIITNENEMRLEYDKYIVCYSFYYDINKSEMSEDIEKLYNTLKKSGIGNFYLKKSKTGIEYLLSKEEKNGYYTIIYNIDKYLQLHIKFFSTYKNQNSFTYIDKDIDKFIPLKDNIQVH